LIWSLLNAALQEREFRLSLFPSLFAIDRKEEKVEEEVRGREKNPRPLQRGWKVKEWFHLFHHFHHCHHCLGVHLHDLPLRRLHRFRRWDLHHDDQRRFCFRDSCWEIGEDLFQGNQGVSFAFGDVLCDRGVSVGLH